MIVRTVLRCTRVSLDGEKNSDPRKLIRQVEAEQQTARPELLGPGPVFRSVAPSLSEFGPGDSFLNSAYRDGFARTKTRNQGG